jgi:hypothetical protein
VLHLTVTYQAFGAATCLVPFSIRLDLVVPEAAPVDRPLPAETPSIAWPE